MLGLVQSGAAGGAWRFLYRSSIGRKLVVSLAGLALCAFLLVHLWGNLLIYIGNGDSFNRYAAFLSRSTLLIPAELSLIAVLVTHMGFAIFVTVRNWQARPTRYVSSASEGRRTIASATMIYTGTLTFLFLIMHLLNFKYGTHLPLAEDGSGGLHRLVVTHYQSLFAVVLYCIPVALLGLHVSHGLQSAFRTLGLGHPKYMPAVEKLSLAFGILIAVGFASIPVWAFVTGVGGPA